jgi:uncharacterized protein (DUF2126 family)
MPTRAATTAPTGNWPGASCAPRAAAGDRPEARLRRLRGRLLLPVARTRLPVNVDPFDAASTTRSNASAWPRSFARASTRSSATCCRCRRVPQGGWQSGPWFLRGGRCYLIPGDSPVGYRLPLDSQPWVAPGRLSLHPRARPDADLPGRCPAHSEIRAQFAVSRSEGLPAPNGRR